MEKEKKKFFGQKISFESIKQPQPDNSPTYEDFAESETYTEQEIRFLKEKIEKNNKVTFT